MHFDVKTFITQNGRYLCKQSMSLENYDVLRLVGTGSYGEVSLVRDKRNSKKVCGVNARYC